MKLTLEKADLLKIILKEFGATCKEEDIVVKADPFEVTLTNLTYNLPEPEPEPVKAKRTRSGSAMMELEEVPDPNTPSDFRLELEGSAPRQPRGTAEHPRELFSQNAPPRDPRQVPGNDFQSEIDNSAPRPTRPLFPDEQ